MHQLQHHGSSRQPDASSRRRFRDHRCSERRGNIVEPPSQLAINAWSEDADVSRRNKHSFCCSTTLPGPRPGTVFAFQRSIISKSTKNAFARRPRLRVRRRGRPKAHANHDQARKVSQSKKFGNVKSLCCVRVRRKIRR